MLASSVQPKITWWSSTSPSTTVFTGIELVPRDSLMLSVWRTDLSSGRSVSTYLVRASTTVSSTWPTTGWRWGTAGECLCSTCGRTRRKVWRNLMLWLQTSPGSFWWGAGRLESNLTCPRWCSVHHIITDLVIHALTRCLIYRSLKIDKMDCCPLKVYFHVVSIGLLAFKVYIPCRTTVWGPYNFIRFDRKTVKTFSEI